MSDTIVDDVLEPMPEDVFPDDTTVEGVRIADMPDMGTVTDNCSFVSEKTGTGSGRLAALAVASYVASKITVPPPATLPPLGAVNDNSLFAGQTPPGTSGTFNALAVANYVITKIPATGARVSVRTYGAKGDGITDDTAAINACIAGTPAGGEIYFPIGGYRVSSPIQLNKNLTINGNGRLSSTIIVASPTADVFVITNAAVDIYDLGFTPAAGVVRTAGAYVSYGSGSVRCRIDRFWMLNPFYGIRITSAGQADYFFSDGEILQWRAAGSGIRVDSGLAVQVSSCLLSQGAAPGAGNGIYITNCGDVDIVACQIVAAGNALFVNPGPGQGCSSIWATETYFDSSICGVQMTAAGGSIARCKFVGCWMSSHSVEGIQMSTSGGGSIGGIDFIGCHIFDNANDGATVFDSGVWDVQFNGCAVAGNRGFGINMNTSNPWRIQNCRIGNSYGFGNNGAGGINIGTGCNGYIIQGNDLTGNSVSPILGGGLYAGLSYVLKDNLGWPTWNGGYGSIAPGQLTTVVAHHLASGSLAIGEYQVMITPTSGQNPGNQLYCAATGVGSFTVGMSATSPVPITFAWQAHLQGAI